MTCLVLVQYEAGRVVSFWLTLGYVVSILVIDCFFLSSKRQTKVFYLPLIIEAVLLACGLIILYFRVPERWFKNNRFFQLILNSFVIYTLILINVVFEVHNILYYTLKSNSSNLEDEEEWWKVKNIYNS